MRTVGIKVLKDKLSEYVHLAASGETVLVTERDRVVAELVPPEQGRAGKVHDAVLADAFRQGWIQPAMNVSAPLPLAIPVAPLREILEGLDKDRADR